VATPPVCTELKTCRETEGEVSATPTFVMPTSGAPTGPGNTGRSEVLPSKEESKPKSTTKKKPLTRAQKLKKALKACKKIKNHKRRVACEHSAHKKYGPKKKSSHKAHKSGRSVR
jgi:hypothetical protein